MMRLKNVLPFLVALIIATIIGGGIAAALQNQTVQGTTNSTVYKVGQNVTIDGTVNGDVFCAGQTVTVNATVNGDILCAAQTIDVNGQINGSVRLVGQTVNFGGTVTRNTSIVAQTADVESSSSTAGDLSLVSQTANVYGSVGRDLSSADNNLNFYSKVGRNATITVNSLYLGSGTTISGDLNYTSPNVLTQASGVKIVGAVTHQTPSPRYHHAGKAWWLILSLFMLVGLVVLTVILVALFPKLFAGWNKKIVEPRPWFPLLVGFIGSFIIPALVIMLFVTVIGLPFGILLLLTWGVISFFALPIAAFFIGKLILKNVHIVLASLVGAIILGLLNVLPFIGTLIWFIAYWFGLGVVLVAAGRAYKNQHTENASSRSTKKA